MLPYSISPVILGFLLGLMFNTVLYVIPEYLVSRINRSRCMKLLIIFRSQALRSSLSEPENLALNFTLHKAESRPGDSVKLLCWILTGPSNHYTKVR